MIFHHYLLQENFSNSVGPVCLPIYSLCCFVAETEFYRRCHRFTGTGSKYRCRYGLCRQISRQSQVCILLEVWGPNKVLSLRLRSDQTPVPTHPISNMQNSKGQIEFVLMSVIIRVKFERMSTILSSPCCQPATQHSMILSNTFDKNQ